MVDCLPMQERPETPVQSLGWKEPLEEEMVSHCFFRGLRCFICDWKRPLSSGIWVDPSALTSPPAQGVVSTVLFVALGFRA